MDADEDAGDVFAIPELWAPSPYIRWAQQSPSVLFEELRFDGANNN
jgi:hypothetical protein